MKESTHVACLSKGVLKDRRRSPKINRGGMVDLVGMEDKHDKSFPLQMQAFSSHTRQMQAVMTQRNGEMGQK